MAEAILYNVAATILENLGSATLGRDLGLVFSAADDLRRLNDTVSAIKAVLLDAEEKQDKSHQLKDWIQKLQDAFYPADDLVDDFRTEAAWRRVAFGGGGGMATKAVIFFSPSNQIAFALRIGGRLKQVRERLDEIASDSKGFHLIERLEDKTRVPPRSSHSFVGGSVEVVGRDEDKSEIVTRLLSTDSPFEVVPIVGIGGLGKTTLAQLVFNDEKVCHRFELRIWVSVSEVFDLKSLLEKILKSITQQSPGDLELDQLQILVRKEVTGKRFLLVLDDVSSDVDSEKWVDLERLLGSGKNGSRVLVTTRSQMVAEIVTQRVLLRQYKLSGLDKDSSLRLFKKAAFGKGPEPENPQFVEMGMEILDKCHGVPLAIKTIGATLFLKRREIEWRSIKDNELINIPQKQDGILPTLKISYNSLPSRLKHCFAYCRLFPKDRDLDVQKLIRLWIAQGFVDPSEDRTQSLEDIGYGYFMDLLWRSFFQDPVLDEWGDVKRCKIHSLMHDLAAFVAGPGSVKIDKDTESLGEKTRHVSFDFKFNGLWNVPESWTTKKKKKNPNLRTFISPNPNAWNSLRCLDRDAMLLSLVSLRTLDLKALGIEELPSDLGELRHLRYLNLSQNRFKLLPGSIIRLQNLQTLILSNCQELVKLPPDTKRLVSLRHLYLKGCRRLTHMPRGVNKLTSLHSLDRFVVAANKNDDVASLGELENLNELRSDLSIENLGHKKSAALESKTANLKDKKNLQSLVLFWKDGSDSGNDEMCLDYLRPHPNVKALKVVNYLGPKFSPWLSSLQSLVKLELASCENCRYLPPLDELPRLKEITLFALTALEYISDKPNSLLSSPSSSTPERPFFRSLTSLKIRFCVNLKGWSKTTTMTSSVFPCLHNLDIRNCPQFVSMPLFPSLRRLELIDTSFGPLKETMMMMKIENSYSPLCELKSLSISQIKDLEYFPEEIGNLKSLESLAIVECDNLTSLPEVIRDLSLLQSLRIRGCLKMESLPVGMSLSGLKLEIENCPLFVPNVA